MKPSFLLAFALALLSGCSISTRALDRCRPFEISPDPGVTPPSVVPSRLPAHPPSGSRVERLPTTGTGWACVQYTINTAGRVESVDVLASSDKKYGKWAAAVQGGFVYKPALKDEKPVPFRSMTVFENEYVFDTAPNRNLLLDGAPDLLPDKWTTEVWSSP